MQQRIWKDEAGSCVSDKITTKFERASDGTGRTLYLAYKGDRALPMTHWAVDEACCLTAARGPLTALTQEAAQ